MLDELRARFAAYLSERHVCILSTAAKLGAWAMPVRYCLAPDGDDRRLELDCLLPHWADATYNLEQDARVLLLIQVDKKPGFSTRAGQLERCGAKSGSHVKASSKTGFLEDNIPLCWLQVQGKARPLAAPDWGRLLPGETARTWPESCYCVLRVTPTRLDLIDESKGWGARETLEVVG